MIAENLKSINERIANALAKSGRPADGARLLAVSKTFPAEVVKEAYDAGQLCFGENRTKSARPCSTPHGSIPSIRPICSRGSTASPRS